MFQRLARVSAYGFLALIGSTRMAAAVDPLLFERDVRPILRTYCLDCHGGSDAPKGGLDLRLARFAAKGGKNGPAVVPGRPEESLLIERVREGDMPPGEKKVPKELVEILDKWVAGGAHTARKEPETLPPGLGFTPEERAYWFFQPLERPQIPSFSSTDRVRTPIDALVLSRLKDKKLAFNPDADKATLIRRATLDLHGLPPTPEEVDAFLKDGSVDAYEKLIDRLLASPRYGERWGRHWLDVAGYSDSEGDGVTDTPRPHAWRYRDYVIKSLNEDKPLDRFVAEQLAGDEMVPRPWTNLKPDQIELLAATGFLRNAPDSTASGGGDLEANQNVADTLKIVSSTFLGLSVGCAQCHDHRYDPIPQADYFRLRAIFEPAIDPSHWRRPGERLVSLYTDADREKAAKVNAEANAMREVYNHRAAAEVKQAFILELEKFPIDQRAKLRAAFETPEKERTPEQKMLVATNPKLNINQGVLYQFNQRAADMLTEIDKTINAKLAEKPAEGFVLAGDERPGVVPPTKIFYRGDHRQPKDEVQPGDLTIAAPEGKRLEIPAKDPKLATTGRRLAFAKHLTNGTHPLFGRVIANRIWLNHFGQGIVDTPGEFGKLGRLPSHPELLDYLALELPARKWSLKSIHRMIMTSTVYRQSSKRDKAKDAVDSSNTLLGRYPVHRLEAEAIRDRLLFTAGKLDVKAMGGPPVAVTVDTVGQVIVPPDAPRRSVYLQQRRTQPVAFLATFDGPSGELNCERRQASAGSPQALMLMNSDVVIQAAEAFAKRIMTATPKPEDRINLAWRLAYQRDPSAEERSMVAGFWERRKAHLLKADPKNDAQLLAWTDVCQQILSSNEVLYVD